MISKRTRIFVAALVLCAAFSVAVGYKDFRRYQEIRVEWRGAEEAMEGMELPPKPPLPFRMALLATMIFLSGTLVSASVDIILWRRSRR